MNPYRTNGSAGRSLAQAPAASWWRRLVAWVRGRPRCRHCGRRLRTRAEIRSRMHLPRVEPTLAHAIVVTAAYAAAIIAATHLLVLHWLMTGR